MASAPSTPSLAAVLDVPLSILDLATVAEGSSERDALLRSVALARHAEALGLNRIWVAEHHGMPAVASAAPDLVMAHLAQATSTIRVGSGGVMLPNHAPLVVAERFATLEAFHPGRIDLGIGRAPGTDPRTSWALRRNHQVLQGDAFVAEVRQLMAFFDGDFDAGHEWEGMRAVPGQGLRPPVWLLGSSTFSARVAALLGQRFAFAHHFAPQQVDEAMEVYRATFQPSADCAEPYAMVTATVICAETTAEAERLATSGALSMVRLRQGDLRPLPSPEAAAAHPWSMAEEDAAEQLTASWIIGTPEECAVGLRRLRDRTAADELMVAGSVWDPDAHRHGLSLLAAAVGLAPPVVADASAA